MMGTALVTGIADRARDVAGALRTEGFETLVLDVPQPEVPAGPGSVTCYVQLPVVLANGAGTDAVMARVDAVAAVSPLLSPEAAVLLVADDPGWDGRRRHALGLLAEAALAGQAGDGVRVSVLGEEASPTDIATTARRQRTGPGASLADMAPGLGFADWRNEVLSLAGSTERTYFGWVAADGRRCVSVLRGTVMSPLVPGAGGVPPDTVGPAPGLAVSWGSAEAPCQLLAHAILADAVGAPDLVGNLAGTFAKDVLAACPPDGFELRGGDVAAWIVRHAPR